MLKKVFIKKKWHSHLFFKSLLLSDDNLEDYKKNNKKDKSLKFISKYWKAELDI